MTVNHTAPMAETSPMTTLYARYVLPVLERKLRAVSSETKDDDGSTHSSQANQALDQVFVDTSDGQILALAITSWGLPPSYISAVDNVTDTVSAADLDVFMSTVDWS